MKSFNLAAVFLFIVCQLAGQVEDFKHIDFRKADSVAQLYPKHSLMNLKTLTDKLTQPFSTDAEKFRAIYSWTCANIEYNYQLFQKNLRQREKLKDPVGLQQWYKKANVMMFDALLRKQKTICTGYAYLIRELSRQAGLTCEIVDGYGRNSISNIGGSGIPSHQWNAIQLNDKWYLCDATWSSGFVLNNGLYVKDYNDSYFLLDPTLFIRNHYPLDAAWTLLLHAPSLQEFLNGPLVYNRLFSLKITQLHPVTFEVEAFKKMPITFQFNADEQSLGNISLSIKGQPDIAYPKLLPDGSGLYSIEHSFTSRGTYVVHISENKQSVFSYKVKVR
jgi:hypothetical protein